MLEASAGTGKTYTIAALAARYVADGIPLDQLLLVTFTRMATGELRERVRERLVSAEQGLERALAGAPPDAGDGVVRLLAQGAPEAVRARRARLARALAAFDAATIATTHGFCQEVLGGLGVAGDVEPGAVLVEEVDDLIEEVVDDLFIRRFHDADVPEFGRAQALEIARLAVSNPKAPIEPRAAGDHTIAAMRRRLAEAVRKELEVRKRRTGVMTYDDLLTRLDDALRGEGGPAAAARLRARYRVVLVDEFQDTDPVQWDILRRAFGTGGVTLVLIGDPKQAIYAFRGADVYAYLDAARAAARRATLAVNWRSDQALIDAYDALFAGARLGHEGIVYRTVRAADANRTPRLVGAPEAAALRVRIVDRDAPSIERTRSGLAEVTSTRRHVADDLAGDVVRLLHSAAVVETRAEDGTVRRREPVRPGHVAVLVRSHRQAAQIRDALDTVEVPAVISGAGSVFGSPSAQDWLRLLEAVERPTHAPRARSAALTPFLGWSAERVACAGEEEWEELHRRLHAWARLLRENGVASLTETLTLAEGLPGRVLAAAEGERRLTDLRHVAQLLHAAAVGEHMGTAALTAWLRQRLAAAEQETADEERSRRLESDAEAVQVITIHRSKGLEFPIVYVPFAFDATWIPRDDVPVDYHDPDAHDARTLDVGMDGPDWPRHKRQHLLEQRAEDLRLFYVALTRARHQAVIWWAGTWGSRDSALGRLLFARDAEGNVADAGRRTPGDAAALARFTELAAAAPGCVGVERSALRPLTTWSPPLPAPAELSAAAFARVLDRRWRRTSYTDITSGAHEARVASEPEEDVLADEPATADAAAGGGPAPGRRRGRRRAAAAGRPAGGRARRHVRAPGARDGRLRRPGPLGRARGGRGRRGGAPSAGRGRPGRAGGRAARGPRDAARPGGGRDPAARRGAGRPAGRAGLRAAAGRRRRSDGARPARRARGGAAAPCRARRSAGRVRRAARGPGAPPGRARLPRRQPRPRGAAPRRRAAALRRAGLQDEPARAVGRGAAGVALPPGRARGGDGAPALPAPGAAVRGRAAPLPALAAARLRPGAEPRRRALPVPARDDRGAGERRGRLAAARGARRGAQRRARPEPGAVSALRSDGVPLSAPRSSRSP